MKSPYKGVTRIFKAFSYSWDGLKAVFRSEAAFRQDVLFCAIGFLALIFVPVSYVEKLLMSFALILILLMELANTAVEVLVDRISPDYHDLSKVAKDIGSLLVLISFLNWVIIWGVILAENFV